MHSQEQYDKLNPNQVAWNSDTRAGRKGMENKQ